jgi:hypothetical protein
MRHRPKNPPPGGAGGERRKSGGAVQPSSDGGLSDTQVMTMLDERRADGGAAHADEATFSRVPLLRPEDTGTRRALRDAVQRGETVPFAVQLLWSATMIDLDNTPRDPIFRSYTVYTTRVCNDGREWFELRLGFFGDAMSAKQVAYYMQREYKSAAVVPVSMVEQAAALFAAGSSRRAAGNRPAVDESAATDTAPAAEPSAVPTPAAGVRPSLFVIRGGGSRRV